MRPLPVSLWLLLAAQIEAREQAQVDPQQPAPTAVRKMPADQGAKFHHEYCAFGDHQAFAPASHKPHAAIAARGAQDEDDARRIWANASAELLPRPPFALLSDSESRDENTPAAGGLFRRAALALAFLEKRQWQCPDGTNSCSSIGFPNSCCGEGEKCMEVPDTGLGPVGCCPAGATCGGGIAECADGSTPCASDIGGGCCIPGFVCRGVGCIRSSSNPPPPPAPTTLTTTQTSIIPGPDPSTTVVTVVITITPSTSAPAVTSTVTQTSTARPPSSSQTTTTTTNNGAGAPFRPTSSPGPTNTNTYCPTGFYACLARAGGGCCQTGRDCATASCPPPAGGLTTVVNDHGITVVVPAAGAPPEATGTGAPECASGWFLCGREAGPVAGCCPRGYECGTASCVAEVTGGEARVAKGLPGNGGGKMEARLGWVVGLGMGVVVMLGGLV